MQREQTQEVSGSTNADPSAALLRTLIMGFRTTQLVHVAAKLSLADHIADAPRTPADLAPLVGADPEALGRVLRALASIGIFTETSEGAFTPTPMADLLRTTTRESLRPLAVLYGEGWMWEAYGRMLQCVETGQTGFEHAHAMSLYEYLETDQAAGRTFDEAMTGYSAQETGAILAAYDFSTVTQVVDVGGGHGALLAALLEAHPHLRGEIFDRESVVQRAGAVMAGAGLDARVVWTGGDFFAAVPAGGDLYLLKSVLHNWDDGRAATILERCRAAMGPDSRLLIIERVVPTGNGPSEAKLFDVNMLVSAGGRERTEDEYRALLFGAGLELTRMIATESPLHILEAFPNRASGRGAE